MSVDELAMIINRSFDHVNDEFRAVRKEIKDGQARLEAGQKEIKKELTFTARKFELKGLESRIEKLEYKLSKMPK